MKKNLYEIIDVLEQLMEIEENIAARSEAGLILSSIQSVFFLCFLSFWGTVLKEINDTQEYMQTSNLNIHQNEMKMAALTAFLAQNREELIENSIKYAKQISNDHETERRVRKKKRLAKKKSNDVGLTFEVEMKRDLYASIDSISQGIQDQFEQLHLLTQRYDFLIQTNLIDEEFEFEFEEEKDVNMAVDKIERKRLKNFLEFSKEKNGKKDL